MGVAWTAGGVVMLAAAGMPAAGAVWYAVISAVIHIGYDLALMNSYRVGAFSQTYPIARGTSPLVVAIGAYVLAGERLGAVPLAGVVILAGGLMSLALSSGRLARRDLPAVGAALLTGLTIASYTIVDGIGVRHAHNALGYGGLLFALQGPVFPVIALLRRRGVRWRERRAAGRAGTARDVAGPDVAGPDVAGGDVAGRGTVSRELAAGVLSLVAYGAVLWAQTQAPLAEVAAIRETSVVFAALIGVIFLREGFGGRRVTAALLIAGGIVLMAI
jgi:drug/metabolite transporter (DMT)-like permease